MPSKKLMLSWWFFNVTLLAAGTVTLALSIVWRQPDLLMNMILPHMDLTGAYIRRVDDAIPTLTIVCCHGPVGLALAVFFLVTWMFSIGAVIQKNHVTGGLVLLNWLLIANMVYLTVAGTFIWFFTLRLRANFHTIFSEQTPSTKIAIQDMVSRRFITLCGLPPPDDFSSSSSVAVTSTERILWRWAEHSVPIPPLSHRRNLSV